MKKLIVTIILVMIISIFCGCAKKITTGTVSNKQFVPEHNTTRIQTIHMYKGPTTQIPITEHHPDAWYITIGGYNEKEEYVYATYKVSEEVYNSINIGDTYTAP